MQGLTRRILLGLSAAALCAGGAVPALALGYTGAPATVSQGGEDDQSKVRLSVRGGRGAEAGKTVRYRFTVRNTGRVAVDSVRVSSRLPRSLKHLRGGRFGSTKRTVAFSLGRIPPGRVRSRVMVARVAEDFEPGGRIALRARVTARSVSDAP